MFIDQIRPVLAPRQHGFSFVDRGLREQISGDMPGYDVFTNTNEVSFNQFDEFQDGQRSLFWRLPDNFLGNQVRSYGGLLKFKLQYSVIPEDGQETRDVDVEFVSGGSRYYILLNPPPRPETPNSYEYRMTEENFRAADGTTPNHNDFMRALSNIDDFIIRATYHTVTISSAIIDLQMDTAVPRNTGQGQALYVEECQCPAGYMGSSCEECDDGYRMENGRCIRGGGPVPPPTPIPPPPSRCDCNRHSTQCDQFGRCLNCQHNTQGERCEQCAAGYYGDATRGSPQDCQPCACPLTIPSNMFARSCYLERDGRPTCQGCQEGHIGRDCGQCAPGYVGDPRRPGDSCRRQGGNIGAPTISINVRKITQTIGATITVRITLDGRGPFSVQWTRQDGRPLPSRASIGGDYALTIQDLQPIDAGIYVVTAVNQIGSDSEEVEIEVLNDQGIRVVVEEPKSQDVQEGDTVTFTCRGVSQVSQRQVSYTLIWTKENGAIPWDRAMDDSQGQLKISNVRQSDAGTYICTGSNFYSEDTDNAVLNVIVSQEGPRVTIDPRFQTVNVGDAVQFTCSATGSPPPLLEWTGGRGGQLPEGSSFSNGVFRIPSARRTHEGEYYCTATNPSGREQVRTILFVKGEDPQPTSRPTPDPGPDPGPSPVPGRFEVYIEREQVQVAVGETAQLTCVARGERDVDIQWTRLRGELPPRSYQREGSLVVPDARREYTGRYQCTGISRSGQSAYAYAVIQVTGDRPPPPTPDPGPQPGGEAPTVSIDPERQTVGTGQSATLRCIVTGSPEPTITWTKVRETLPANAQVQGNVLRIPSVGLGDRGMYVCTAENSAGTARQGAILEIERREMPVIELFPEATISIATGGSALFQCRVTGGSPPPTIVWTRANNERFTSSTEVMTENGVLRFLGVTGEEAGSYICTATNPMGSVTATATLRIQGRTRVILSPSTPQRLYEGQALRLECTAEGDPTPNVYWETPQARDAPLAAPRPQPGSAVLNIVSVTYADQGVYTCVADNGQGRMEERIQVTVERQDVGPPPIGPPTPGPGLSATIIPAALTVVEGQTVRFTCSAAGYPPPQITWRRRDGPMPPQHFTSGGILEIPGIRAEYQGEYVCLVRNSYGQAEKTVILTVQEDEEQGQAPPSISPAPSTLRAGINQRLILTCEASGTQPITYTWEKIDGPLSQYAVIRGSTLEISRVTPSDGGRYRCIAANQAGRAEAYTDVQISGSPSGGSGGPAVQVIPDQREVQAGESAEFLCEGRGFPPPTIQWTRESGPLPQQHRMSGGALLLYNLRPEDSGRYICTASNNFGSNVAYAMLRVGGGVGPGPGPGPVREQQQSVSVGDRVDLECHVSGSPRPTVRWERVNSDLPSTSIIQDHLLIIPAVGPEDGGTYRCVAYNNLGTVYAQISLIVEAAPVFTMERQVKAATVGSRVSLTCEAFGNPPPSVTWSKRRGDLPDDHEVRDGTLLIPSLSPGDFGEYVCTASNRFGTTESVVILEHQGEFVPYFTQNPTSYISYPTLRDAYLDFDLELSFNPETSDGLLIYNGQNISADGDFMCLGMRDNAVEFRFDVGSGPVIIRSDPVDLNQWHTIRVQRDRKDGTLIVNGREYRGQVDGQFVGLDLEQPMYVGGVPNYRMVSPGAGYRQGFVGGVSRVEIRGVPLDIQTEALELVGVREFPVCQSRPCQRGGTCSPAATDTGYKCDCPPGYSGLRCELVGDRCYPGVCGSRGTCIDLANNLGYKCVCPVGRSGERCEQGFQVNTPAFDGNSYIAYPKIEDAQQQVQISLMFRPRSLEDGILLYNAAGTDGYGDFISLAIKDRHLEFRYDSGSGTAVIRSQDELQQDQWTTLVAERNQRDGSLSINGGVAVKGQSEGSTIGLNLRSPLYIGGVDPSTRIAPGVGVTRGFHGCISDLVIRGQAIDMAHDAIGFIHIRDCDRDESPCARRPCQNNGVCEELSATDYSCRCPSQFTGLNCEIERNVCTQQNPCQNGATCEADPRTGTFRCLCPLGFSGATCGSVVRISTAAGFRGDGYIELPASLLPHSSPQVTEVVSMTIRTDQSDGLLFWHGQNATKPTRGADYLGVGLQNGHVVFTYEFGSGPANITSVQRVDDGRDHDITLIRTGKAGNLELDGTNVYEGSSGGILQMLNTEGNIYIGGTPNQELMTNGLFSFSLIGCISNLRIQNQGPIDLSRQSVGGVNVQPCV